MLGLSVVKSGGQYYAMVASNLGITRVSFGSSITNPNPQRDDLGVFNSVNFAIGHRIVKSESKYYSVGLNINGRLSILEFPGNCDNDDEYLGEQNPVISFDTPGTYAVTLSASGSDNEFVSVTKSITITSDVAQPFVINENGACVNNPVTFKGEQANGAAITGLSWDFGNGAQGSGQDATYQYSGVGTYSVVLTAAGANGCINRVEKNIEIYDPPSASFTPPSGSLCSNAELTFVNTTADDFDGNLTYQWVINGQTVSTERDLVTTLPTVSTHEVTLEIFIPGCSDNDSQNIVIVLEGPVVDFSITGNCQNNDVSFTNTSTGSISGFSWDFGDGQSFIGTHALKVYTDVREYEVVLTAFSPSGCDNTKTKSLTIHSTPQVDFYASPPPFSCSGTATNLNDITPNPTDSNLSTWQWNFGDAGSGQNTSETRNPQHTYNVAGVYDVTLTVTTNFLCSSTLQLPITISQSPTANFTNPPACEDVPTLFTDASTGTITGWNWQMGSTFYTGSGTATHTFANAGNVNASLMVTASNGCVASTTKPLVVPAKLVPDFSVFKNCTNQQTLFTDVTNSATDPLISQSWNFGGLGNGVGSPEIFTFENMGNVNVTMTLLAQSGCQYFRTKLVSIAGSPTASFTATPEAGGPPLEVEFTNTSTNATSYLWAFGDDGNTTSTDDVPDAFTYANMGDYLASLTAYNALNCSHTVTQVIKVLNAILEVAINGLQLIEFPDGSVRPAVTIFNNGNIPVSNVGLILNMPGPVILDRVPVTIKANASYRHVFDFEFPVQYDGGYFCIEADVEDAETSDNTACLSLDAPFTVVAPHPNPAYGQINLSWILKEDGLVKIEIVNAMGQRVTNFQVDCQEGLTPISLNADGWGAGVYFVKIQYNQISKVYRVLVLE
jgi:PKD repeat protein